MGVYGRYIISSLIELKTSQHLSARILPKEKYRETRREILMGIIHPSDLYLQEMLR